LAPGHRYPVVQIRAQFRSDYFEPIAPADWDKRPFTMLFIGRLTEYKGVLDIAHMARRIEDQHPGLVRWIICGRGPASDQLATLRDRLNLHEVIDLKGWTSLEDLQSIYSTAHACIVPTRSNYAEGLAMTTAEAVLAGRPFVSNPVVPGSEVLADACVTARTDDIVSHADAVLQLASNKNFYEEKVEGARRTGRMFLDRSLGLTAGLHKIRGYALNRRL
jgi:glycosyltransferase involved in cell wall biosynthesis